MGFPAFQRAALASACSKTSVLLVAMKARIGWGCQEAKRSVSGEFLGQLGVPSFDPTRKWSLRLHLQCRQVSSFLIYMLLYNHR